jgi:hypothetical protein
VLGDINVLWRRVGESLIFLDGFTLAALMGHLWGPIDLAVLVRLHADLDGEAIAALKAYLLQERKTLQDHYRPGHGLPHAAYSVVVAAHVMAVSALVSRPIQVPSRDPVVTVYRLLVGHNLLRTGSPDTAEQLLGVVIRDKHLADFGRAVDQMYTNPDIMFVMDIILPLFAQPKFRGGDPARTHTILALVMKNTLKASVDPDCPMTHFFSAVLVLSNGSVVEAVPIGASPEQSLQLLRNFKGARFFLGPWHALFKTHADAILKALITRAGEVRAAVGYCPLNLGVFDPEVVTQVFTEALNAAGDPSHVRVLLLEASTDIPDALKSQLPGSDDAEPTPAPPEQTGAAALLAWAQSATDVNPQKLLARIENALLDDETTQGYLQFILEKVGDPFQFTLRFCFDRFMLEYARFGQDFVRALLTRYEFLNSMVILKPDAGLTAPISQTGIGLVEELLKLDPPTLGSLTLLRCLAGVFPFFFQDWPVIFASLHRAIGNTFEAYFSGMDDASYSSFKIGSVAMTALYIVLKCPKAADAFIPWLFSQFTGFSQSQLFAYSLILRAILLGLQVGYVLRCIFLRTEHSLPLFIAHCLSLPIPSLGFRRVFLDVVLSLGADFFRYIREMSPDELEAAWEVGGCESPFATRFQGFYWMASGQNAPFPVSCIRYWTFPAELAQFRKSLQFTSPSGTPIAPIRPVNWAYPAVCQRSPGRPPGPPGL